ncbi:MAG: NfeD family protein [Erysipelotrichaceae bacterium]|nr:NfeD family protein [Erysipelotrichaceae bacterium]
MTIWLIIIILSIIIEIVTLDLVSIWISVGGLCALIAELLGFNLTIQIIVCIVITFITLLLVRPLSKRYLTGNIVHTNVDRLIGKHALVTKDITMDNIGEVKISGNFWSAKGLNNETIITGDHVEVLAIDGVKLIVKKI